MACSATAPNVTAVDRRRAPRRLRRRRFLGTDSRKERNLILDRGEFYILASKEAVRVLPDYSAEMVPFDSLVSEFRVQYAGYSTTQMSARGAGGALARGAVHPRARRVWADHDIRLSSMTNAGIKLREVHGLEKCVRCARCGWVLKKSRRRRGAARVSGP